MRVIINRYCQMVEIGLNRLLFLDSPLSFTNGEYIIEKSRFFRRAYTNCSLRYFMMNRNGLLNNELSDDRSPTIRLFRNTYASRIC